jgi:hypothetical protein
MVDALVWSLSVAVNALICSAVSDVTSCIQVIYIEHSRAETQTWVPMRTWWLLSFYAAALVLCVHNAIVYAHISIILLLCWSPLLPLFASSFQLRACGLL